jgi:hypothetical protein
MPLPVEAQPWTCPQCGTVLMLKPYQARRRKVCSRKCLYASIRGRAPRYQPRPVLEERVCEWCGERYEARAKHARYCSQLCASRANAQKNRRLDIQPRPCESCGTIFRPRPGSAGRFCSRACTYAGSKGKKAAHWRGGRYVTAEGYVKVYAPDHPESHGRGGYVMEHRLVMEQVLGRRLVKGESVHHINGQHGDNRPENLQLRQGKHGAGVRLRCADCGSEHLEPVPI